MLSMVDWYLKAGQEGDNEHSRLSSYSGCCPRSEGSEHDAQWATLPILDQPGNTGQQEGVPQPGEVVGGKDQGAWGDIRSCHS